jgi:dUTP pyrophosphatase
MNVYPVSDPGGLTAPLTFATGTQIHVMPNPATLNYQRVSEPAIVLSDADEGNAGIDLRSSQEYELNPGQITEISTGIAVEIPKNYCGLILGRSGLAFKTNILVPHIGLIDASYRGEIKVLLLNFGLQKFHIHVGDRIAQLLVLPYLPTHLNQVASLSESNRGTQGFGSTGIS